MGDMMREAKKELRITMNYFDESKRLTLMPLCLAAWSAANRVG